jgi:hypothetical protein
VDDFAPSAVLHVKYPHVEVSIGNTISPADAQDIPEVRISPDHDDDSVFTLVRHTNKYNLYSELICQRS